MFWNKKIEEIDLCDIHSHIVPGVDDGAQNMEKALQMLEVAYEDGIRTIVATPHFHPGKCMIEQVEIRQTYDKFVEIAKSKHRDMNFSLGRELYYHSDVAEKLEESEELCYEGTHYVLIEFSTNENWNNIKNAISRVIQGGHTPVVAHVERYGCIVDNEEYVLRMRKMGAIITVNASSVMGELGGEIKGFLKRLLKQRLIDVITTDAHSAYRRPLKLKECYEYVCKKIDADYAIELFSTNPLKIIGGKEI